MIKFFTNSLTYKDKGWNLKILSITKKWTKFTFYIDEYREIWGI